MKWTRLAAGIYHCENFVAEPDIALQECKELTFVQRRACGARVPRTEAWYGDRSYRFSGHTFPATPMPAVLTSLAIRAESVIPESAHFSTALVNRYEDGSDSVAWHSDDEPDMGDPIIASVSLGATRRFLLRRKVPVATMVSAMLPNKLAVELAHGSLLFMGRGVQSEWLHSVPKTRKPVGERINVTFRAPGL